MGIAIKRSEDHQLYMDAYEEAQRIIRISDEVRMSLEKVNVSEQSLESNHISGVEQVKISSSKLAKKLGVKTKALLETFTEKGLLEFDGEQHSLTESGENIGGELKFSKRFGPYFVWPETLTL